MGRAKRKYPNLKADGFVLSVFRDEGHHLFQVFSTTPGGAMYGGLELAEQFGTRAA